MTTRRDFLKHSALGAAGLTIGGLGFSTESFANIMGANEKIRVGIVGFSDRARHSLIPAFMACADELGFEIVAISDIWKRRREEPNLHGQLLLYKCNSFHRLFPKYKNE